MELKATETKLMLKTVIFRQYFCFFSLNLANMKYLRLFIIFSKFTFYLLLTLKIIFFIKISQLYPKKKCLVQIEDKKVESSQKECAKYK